MFYVGVSDKILMPYLKHRSYMDCADEGEAVALGAGYYFATGSRPYIFMSADGLCNALNFITSWIMPEGIPMNLIISTGRLEAPHRVMTGWLPDILKFLELNAKNISIKIIERE